MKVELVGFPELELTSYINWKTKEGEQMKPQEMWNAYKQINPSIGDEIDAWAFGVEADLLADVEDKDLTKVFNCVCDSFESYSKGCSEA